MGDPLSSITLWEQKFSNLLADMNGVRSLRQDDPLQTVSVDQQEWIHWRWTQIYQLLCAFLLWLEARPHSRGRQ